MIPGWYYDECVQNQLKYTKHKRELASVTECSVLYICSDDKADNKLCMSECHHLDILAR